MPAASASSGEDESSSSEEGEGSSSSSSGGSSTTGTSAFSVAPPDVGLSGAAGRGLDDVHALASTQNAWARNVMRQRVDAERADRVARRRRSQ